MERAVRVEEKTASIKVLNQCVPLYTIPPHAIICEIIDKACVLAETTTQISKLNLATAHTRPASARAKNSMQSTLGAPSRASILRAASTICLLERNMEKDHSPLCVLCCAGKSVVYWRRVAAAGA